MCQKRNFLAPTTNAGVETRVVEIEILENPDFLRFPLAIPKIGFGGDHHRKIAYASAVNNMMMFPVVFQQGCEFPALVGELVKPLFRANTMRHESYSPCTQGV